VPVKLTPEMMTAAQINSEIGAEIASNWIGAYSCFEELWRVWLAAAPPSPGAAQGAEPVALTDERIEQLANRAGVIYPARVSRAQAISFARFIEKELASPPASPAPAREAQLEAVLKELVTLEADGKHAGESAIEAWERARAALSLSSPGVQTQNDQSKEPQ
jgi:hypothetical protein